MLNYAKQFDIFCFLDNQEYSFLPHRYECILAIGGEDKIFNSTNIDFNLISTSLNKQWVFGHLNFELGYHFLDIHYSKEDLAGFPLSSFFTPDVVMYIQQNELIIEGEDSENIYKALMNCREESEKRNGVVSLKEEYTKKEYLEIVEHLKEHIHRGDCYEINFCQGFYSESRLNNPVQVYRQLAKDSPAPFSALYKLTDKWLICSSPERFLYKDDGKIISQPMKGTAKRDHKNKLADDKLKQDLKNSAKERAENVMIVDLVRNDLSRICRGGTVKVDELFGVYSFPQVHQMVSTIRGELSNENMDDIFKTNFPMGSMTGAPKKRVIELIKEYEKNARGIFSGCVGYINPDGDFDFNVVIRSIMYNDANSYLSYKVGSGITFYSDPDQEWEECMWKGAAIKKVLT